MLHEAIHIHEPSLVHSLGQLFLQRLRVAPLVAQLVPAVLIQGPQGWALSCLSFYSASIFFLNSSGDSTCLPE
jgi:hypothetical protein